mmetsp:Transcript_18589/g.28714  ORF Transcript_18589/g.28714 Transcript_18589/m.28714 type:complete len:147 (+) Transcript_18589:119-559(+)|eukprot:CAMPEP_0195282982 /NCGR_PEP_ID=MMETSP0707-20130614/1682_1 /TAXON_ID=33640 /ORGANISM="Asterionellopsis glacialis, Strain CCMP134" /LENGTH=146 /DNA_ID=CAMNT_0040342073 /DNA_START=17 /DNA_END=457 /DNA_ORIENTATION=+
MSRSAYNLNVQEDPEQLPIRGPAWSKASIRRGSDHVEMSEETIKKIEETSRTERGLKKGNSFFPQSLSSVMSGVLSSLQDECAEESKLHPMKKEQLIALEVNRQSIRSIMRAVSDDDEFHKIQEAIRAKGARTGISAKALLFAKGA